MSETAGAKQKRRLAKVRRKPEPGSVLRHTFSRRTANSSVPHIATAKTLGIDHLTLGSGLTRDFARVPAYTAERNRAQVRPMRHWLKPGAGGGTPWSGPIQRIGDDESKTLTGKVTMLFNGEELVVSNNGSEAVRFPATSGRPTKVKSKHALKCKGSVDETYVNNPRYVAIKDHGAIPEGKYSFRASQVQEFSEAEQTELIDAARRGKKSIRVGTPKSNVHTGDWGRGRVHLNISSMQPGPEPCTNTKRRSGFYLHGGILSGSAGCIDIGSQFDDLAAMLKGNTKRIDVTVKYKEGAKASLSRCELMFGEIMYEHVTPNPLTFIPCFSELTDKADPESKRIFESLRRRFLGLSGGSGGTPGAGPGGPAPAPDLGAALRSLLRLIGGG